MMEESGITGDGQSPKTDRKVGFAETANGICISELIVDS